MVCHIHEYIADGPDSSLIVDAGSQLNDWHQPGWCRLLLAKAYPRWTKDLIRALHHDQG